MIEPVAGTIKENASHNPKEAPPTDESYTKFFISIHKILAQVKDKSWLKRPPPLKGDPTKRDTNRNCAFHGTHGHYINDCYS